MANDYSKLSDEQLLRLYDQEIQTQSNSRHPKKATAPKTDYQEEGVRALARTGKIGATGLASVGDLVNMPFNAVAGLFGYPDLFGSPSQLVGNAIDEATGGLTKPLNNLERAVDAAGEFVVGGIPFLGAAKGLAGISKYAPEVAKLAPQSISQLLGFAGAGAGSEVAHQIAPENPLSSILGALLGGVAVNAGASVVKGSKNAISNNIESLSPSTLQKNETKNVTEFLNRISKGYKGETNQDIRKTAKDIIEEKIKKRQEKAQPFYRAANPVPVGTKEPIKVATKEPIQMGVDHATGKPLYKESKETGKPRYKIQWPKQIADDPTIINAINKAWTIPIWRKQLAGFDKNSTKTLQLAKEYIDDQIGAALKGNERKKAAALIQSKNRLVNTIEEVNPIYKKARTIFADESPAINALKESRMGQLSNLTDLQLKRVGREIFDKLETNPKRYEQLRDAIYKANPKAWKAITRQELERKIGSAELGTKNFYDKALKDPKNFQLLHDALHFDPKAQAQLKSIKKAFAKSYDNPTVLNTISKVPRRLAQNLTGPEVLDVLLNPKWKNEFELVAEGKRSLPSALERIANDSIRPVVQTKNKQETASKHESVNEFESMSDQELLELYDQYLNNIPESNDLDIMKQSSITGPTDEIEDEIENEESMQNTEQPAANQPELVTPQLIDKIAAVESSNNPNAKSKTSSASGLLQFTDSTWQDGVNRYGKELGITEDQKTDPDAQRKLATRMLEDNAAALEQHLDRPPTDGEIYMTHFLGLGGTLKLLEANGNALAANTFPAEAAANKNIFYANGRSLTNSQLYDRLNALIAYKTIYLS